MKKQILLFAICLMAISLSLQAQKRSHHGGKHHVEKMKQDLDLSDNQVKQIEEMGASLKEEMMTIKSSDLEREEKHAQMKALAEKKKAMMDNILTAEQKQKMDEIHAERKAKHEGRREGMKEKHEAMKAFMNEKVKPYMASQRAKLDKEMKKKDRKQINKLRAIAKDFRTELKEKHEAKREKMENGEKTDGFKGTKRGHKGMHGKKGMHHRGPKGHDGRMMKMFQKENEAAYKQAAEYATKYASEIDQIMEESHSQIKEWKEEMRPERKGGEKHGKKGSACTKDKTSKKGGAACCEDKTAKQGPACCEGKKACKKGADLTDEQKAERKEEMKQMKRIDFLLMPSELDKDETNARETATMAVLESKVYPNPSSDANTLEVSVPENAKYLIELYNETGSKLRVVSNSKLDKGNHSFKVDLSNLPSGLYYYVINNGKDQITQKFIKK